MIMLSHHREPSLALQPAAAATVGAFGLTRPEPLSPCPQASLTRLHSALLAQAHFWQPQLPSPSFQGFPEILCHCSLAGEHSITWPVTGAF